MQGHGPSLCFLDQVGLTSRYWHGSITVTNMDLPPPLREVVTTANHKFIHLRASPVSTGSVNGFGFGFLLKPVKSTFVQPRCNNPIIPALRLFRGCVPPTATDYHVRNWSVQALPESTLSWACRVLAYESTTRELVVACLACA